MPTRRLCRRRRWQLAFVCLCVTAGGGCDNDPVGPTYQVRTVLSPGVLGTPEPGEVSYSAGTTISYGFQAASGYRNLRVELDGAVMGASGTITVSADRILVVTADADLSVELADTLIARLYSELLTASNPMVVYRQLLSEAERMTRQMGSIETLSRLETIATLTYDPVGDAPDLWRASRVIGDSLAATSALSLSKGQPQGAPGMAHVSTPVLFLYVNGIRTLPLDWAYTYQTALPELVSDAGFEARYPVEGFYNASSLYQTGPDGEMLVCEYLKAQALSLELYSFVRQVGDCVAAQGLDLVESLVQMVLRPVPAADAVRLAGRIALELRQGRRVVVVAHSQGNLMAQQALTELRDAANLACVAVVGIAPPTSAGWPVGNSALQQLMVQGRLSRDIMLYIPRLHSAGQHPHDLTDRVETNLSRQYDERIDRYFGSSLPSLGVYWAYKLHGIGAYLGSDGSRERIRQALIDQVRDVSERCAFEFAVIAGTYAGPVDTVSEGRRLNAAFTFTITQSEGELAGNYSISGTFDGSSVTGTGTLAGSIAVGTNPEVRITSRSEICPNISNDFNGTYDDSQQAITLIGTVHIFSLSTCELLAAYPNAVINFTRTGMNRVMESDRRQGSPTGG